MPILEKTIQSFSSEDPRFPAKNLTMNPVKKWQCASASDKEAYVIFKLPNQEEICGIDVGNNHAAFVEIWAAVSENPTEFEQILVTSSFMTPLESRESSNSSRVRCFQTEKLEEITRKKKWDLIKVRCTQPFNKHVQYGVSFITLHSVPKKKEKNSEFDISWSSKKVPSPKKAATSFGKFKIARSGSESSDDNISSFQKWRNFKKSNETSSSAKTIEPTLKEKIESLKKAEKRRQSFKNDDEEDSSNQKLDRNRNSLLYDMDDDLPNEKLEKKIRLDKSHSSTSTNKAETTSKSNSKKTDITDEATKRKFDFLFDNNPPDRSSSNSTSKSKSSEHRSSKESPKKGDHHSRRDSPKKSERSDKSSSSSRHSRSDDSKSIKSSPSKSSNHNRDADKKTPSKHDKRSNSSKHAVTYQPFKKLLSGVVFVISGIQNPDRNDLRKKALELGGKYKSDWDSSCTHLICAFKNTPKYVQVLGEGKIVDKRWIEKCYKEKKRLSWRNFALDEPEREKDDSDGEVFDISLKPESPKLNKSRETKRTAKPEVNRNRIQYSSDDNDDMDVQVISPTKPSVVDIVESSDDDMVVSKKEEVKELVNRPEEKSVINDHVDNSLSTLEAKNVDPVATILDCSTDEELDFSRKINKENSVDTQVLNEGKKVLNDKLIYLNEDLSEIDKIKLKKNIANLKGNITENKEAAQIIIAVKKGNVSGTYTGVLVKPLWIYECNDMECLIPTSRYQL